MRRDHHRVAGAEDALHGLEKLRSDHDVSAELVEHVARLLGVECRPDPAPRAVLEAYVAEDSARELIAGVVDGDAGAAERLAVPEHPHLVIGTAHDDAHGSGWCAL